MVYGTPGDPDYPGQLLVMLFFIEFVPAMLLGLIIGHFLRRNVQAIVAAIAGLSLFVAMAVLALRKGGDVVEYLFLSLLLGAPAVPSALFGILLARLLQRYRRGRHA
jgi:hypothetical protein